MSKLRESVRSLLDLPEEHIILELTKQGLDRAQAERVAQSTAARALRSLKLQVPDAPHPPRQQKNEEE